MKDEKEKPSRFHWYVILAGCGLIGTCLGLGINVSGLFFTAVAEELGCGRGSAAATLTVYNLMHAFTGLIAPKALQRFGLKKMVILGTVLQVVFTFSLSLASAVSGLWVLNALRGFAAGLIGTVSVTILINHWFQKDNGLMISLAIGFSGLAGALLSPLFSAIILQEGWRTGYQVMAGIALLFSLPALILPITLRPEEKGLKAYGKKEGENRAEKPEEAEAFVFSGGLYFLVILYGITTSAVSAFPSHFAGLAENYSLAGTGALMVSACMIVNTAGKVIIGKWMDVCGVERPVSVFCVLIGLSCLSLLLFRLSSLLILSAGIFGLCYALSTVSLAVMTRSLFGVKRYSDLYPMAMLVSTASHAVFTVLFGLFYDQSGNYSLCLFVCFAMTAVSLILCLLAYRGREGR